MCTVRIQQYLWQQLYVQVTAMALYAKVSLPKFTICKKSVKPNEKKHLIVTHFKHLKVANTN